MTLGLGWAYAFNILINSTLVFLTVALLVKFLLWAFRIEQPRMQALCLCIPLFKIGVDFFLYNFSRWALAHQIDPFQCEPGTRAITAMFSRPASTAAFVPFNTGIHFIMLGDGKTFTFADLITLSVNPIWIKMAVVIVGSMSMGFCVLKLFKWIKSHRALQKLLEASLPCDRTVRPSLQAALKKSKTRIFISSDFEIPCAVSGARCIIFPDKLLLSSEEFEAIVVHELEHLRWRDSYLRMALELLCAVFWWIPTKRWRSSLAQAQELACDAKITHFKISPVHLAEAIAKTAHAARTRPLPAINFVEPGRTLSRIQSLLKPRKRALSWRIAQTILMGGLLIPIFFGQFWIF